MRSFLATSLVLLATAATAAAGQWWVPAAAHAQGAGGSVWRTDLVVHNFGPTDTTVTVTLLAQGADNSALATTASLAVPAGDTLVTEDAVATLFGTTGNGALKLDAAADQLVVTSRTFNQSPQGTFGQAIPGVAATAALGRGQTALLVGLAGTGGNRTNLGWVSLEPAATHVTVELVSATGESLGAAGFAEQPYGQTQLNDVFARLGVTPVASACARVTADGLIVPYASVVAPGSNDPVYVAAASSLDLGTELLFPAVAHSAGAAGSSWRTDAWVLNTASQPAIVVLELWLQNQANPSPARRTVTLAAGEQLALPDVVLDTFGLGSAQGALALHSDQLVLATSRTYNTAPAGTYGQSIPARLLTSLPGRGETAYLTGAAVSSGYRSNLGLVATSSGSRVDLTLRAADGSVLATASRSLGAAEQTQVNLGALFDASDFAGATVELALAAADADDAVVAAYLSVVDAASSDPTYVEAARSLGEDPGLDQVEETVIATTRALNAAVGSSGPKVIGGKAADAACVTVSYSGDTLLPGQSPEGKCWQAQIAFAGCEYGFDALGWAFRQEGEADADVCVVDGYPSTLAADLTTTLTDTGAGAQYVYGLDALLRLVLGFGQGARPQTALLAGEVHLDVNGAAVDGWADLAWDATVGGTGFQLFPVGVLRLEFPYPTETGTTTAEVSATFDGSEWVVVEVRLGYYHASFCVNLYTGEVRVC